MIGHRNDWRRTMVLFALTGLVESLAWGHMSAFTPLFLQELGVPMRAVPSWTGILSALGFVLGLPLLPFWGVWADRYSRKLIIVRSSVAAAVVYAVAAASRDVYMLAFARFLGGFVLGNTGVWMAVQAEITPRERLGTTVAIISGGSPIGMAVGPYLGGLLVERAGIRALLAVDAALTLGIAIALILFLREEPRVRETSQTVRAGVLAALRAVAHTHAVRGLFGVTFLLAFGLSMAQPYVPLVVEHLHHGPNLPRAIGAVLTAAGIAMAIATPLWGPIGDRGGHLRMLRVCALCLAAALAGQAMATSVVGLGVWRAAQGLCQGGFSALAMVLLALYTPPERRSSVLTLSLFPQQVSWFAAPLVGSLLAEHSLSAPFWAGAVFLLAGWIAAQRLPAPGDGR